MKTIIPLLTIIVLCCCPLLLASGCTGTIRKTTTARTSEEQLYLSTATEQSVRQMDFTTLAGQRVFIDEQYLKCVDQNYAVSLVREQAMIAGCKLSKTREAAQTILELRSGAVGTYARDLEIGIPSVLVPGQNYQDPGSLPKLIELGYSTRQGWANIQGFAFDRQSGRYLTGSTDDFGYGYQIFIFENIYPPTQSLENLGETLK